MNLLETVLRPSKEEQKAAMLSHDALVSILNNLKDQNPKIEIEETQDQIRIPIGALKLLAKILNETSQGKLVSIVPIAMK